MHNSWDTKQVDYNNYFEAQDLFMYGEHERTYSYADCDNSTCNQMPSPPMYVVNSECAQVPSTHFDSSPMAPAGYPVTQQCAAPLPINYPVQYSNNQAADSNNVPKNALPFRPFSDYNRYGSPSVPLLPAYYNETESYAPCQGPRPWNYAYCYGYYGQPSCQFADVVDIEDFMSNEKRKEKSRDAARCRRFRETEIFTELADVLPLSREDVEQLDKASIMRISIAYLKIRHMLKLFPKVSSLLDNEEAQFNEDKEEKPFDCNNSSENLGLLTEALDGFLLILSDEGDVTYVSENISTFLGISQIDILGQQIWEYSHQCDHNELKEALNMRKAEINEENSKTDDMVTAHRDLFIRFKCTLTSRGRNVNIKSASYKIIHLTGHIAMNTNGDRVLIAVGRPLPHPSNIEIPLGSTTFLTKHTLDMKFSYVDDKMLSLLGYQPDDLLGKSLYDCHHGMDSESLMSTFKTVFSKGQAETYRYRFLGKFGGFCWLVTQAAIVYDKQKPQSVVCVNYVVSGLENNNEIYSCAQLEALRKKNDAQQKTKDSNHQELTIELRKQQYQQQQKSEVFEKSSNVLSDKANIADIIVITAKTDINKNNCNSERNEESSLSPIRRTFDNCKISSTGSHRPEPCPKSVTASVFTQIRVPDRNVLLSSILNNSTISSQPTYNSGSRAQTVTASVFTPISALPNFSANNQTLVNNNSVDDKLSNSKPTRSEGMNKGLSPFSDNITLTMLKEETGDLTHLAPTAGDARIALDESVPLFGEMLEGLISPDSYGALLNDDINSIDSQENSCNEKKHFIDPFINYREESNDTNRSSHLQSPEDASKSADVSSIPSLCSPDSLSHDDEFAFMTMNVEDDVDLAMRAPYIPMNEQEDLPLLPDDLMWGTFTEELKDIKEALQIESIKNGTSINNSGFLNSNCRGTNNSNCSSNDSTLASLLCGNFSAQHQSGPSLSDDVIENTRKSKYDQSEVNSTDLADNIDMFGQALNSNSNGCWTTNDLLQIQPGQSSTGQKLQESSSLPDKNNIFINQAMPVTVHVPLKPPSRNNVISNGSNNICTSNSLLECSDNDPGKDQIMSDKLHSTTPLLNTTLNGFIGNKLMSCSNKRHLNAGTSLDTKRVKNSSSVEIQMSTQLLQQLISSTPDRQKSKPPFEKNQDRQWIPEDGGLKQAKRLVSSGKTSSSDSVLKNLLVSGCDKELWTKEKSRCATPNLQMLPDYNCIGPISSKTSTCQVLRYLCTGSNPMISGASVLCSSPNPSPPVGEDIIPELISPENECNPTADAAIQCSAMEIISPSKSVKHILKTNDEINKKQKKQSSNAYYITDPPPLEQGNTLYQFKDNPLSSPFLLDLCSDDYTMDDTLEDSFLQDSEMNSVINELT